MKPQARLPSWWAGRLHTRRFRGQKPASSPLSYEAPVAFGQLVPIMASYEVPPGAETGRKARVV